MSLNIRPVFSAMVRNPSGAVLVALEIAIAIAVLVNSVGIVAQRIEEIDRPTGIDQSSSFTILFGGLTSGFDAASAIQQDLAYLRGVPGVIDAVATEGIPLSGDGDDEAFYSQSGRQGARADASILQVDEQGLKTLGVTLVAGRNFRADEIQLLSKGHLGEEPAVAIVTQHFARALFPSGDALGKTLYDGQGNPLAIIGITHDFMGPHLSNHAYDSVMLPQIPGGYGFYNCIVRTQPGRARAIMQVAERHLAASNPQRIIFLAHTLSWFKRQQDSQNRAMALFLTAVTALILVVTCLGIFGLTTFNVSTRTKQIGTLRAVGARQRDVVAHFLLENAIVLAMGMLVGCTLALGIGYWLTTRYQVPRLNLAYLGLGVLLLGAIGQLAAWQPARKAAAVPPSVATRTI
ncbi:MAG TPA: FtsX-like permease family protein [Steroidobacteraceae bacterium]|nr:FtsX-like permease family protein [Steroidobacteraceae bacterium]